MRGLLFRIFYSFTFMSSLMMILRTSSSFSLKRANATHRSMAVASAFGIPPKTTTAFMIRRPHPRLFGTSSSSSDEDPKKKNAKETQLAEMPPATSSSSSSSRRLPRWFRRSVGVAYAVGGFVQSAAGSLAATRISQQYRKQWKPMIHSLQQFLKQTNVGDEFLAPVKIWKWTTGDRLGLLIRTQEALFGGLDGSKRWESLANSSSTTATTTTARMHDKAAHERYLRHATAVYGDAMMRAVRTDVHGELLWNATTTSNIISLASISKRLSLPGNDDDTTTRIKSRTNNTSDGNATFESTITTRMAEYVGLDAQDLVHVQVDYAAAPVPEQQQQQQIEENDGNTDRNQPPPPPQQPHSEDTVCLRHYVAIDHEHKEVLLVMRGTFSLSEIFVDVAGFTRPFCGGEAHAEMANMAQAVWSAAGDTVRKLLDQHPDYRLIITGHSLGAGTASLLHIWLHHDATKEQQDDTGGETSDTIICKGIPSSHLASSLCVGFATPPVFGPFDSIPSAAAAQTVAWIHRQDVVPFLSVDSIRHLLASWLVVGEVKGGGSPAKSVGWRKRMRYILGREAVPQEWVNQVQQLLLGDERLKPKPGAPLLTIPAQNIWWLTPKSSALENDDGDDEYQAIPCDAERMAKMGLFLHRSMILDHAPPRYVEALHQLVEDEP